MPRFKSPDSGAPVRRFGAFTFDTASLRLAKGVAPVPLSGLPLRLLQLMLESPGRVVTRAELKQAFWPHAVRIDTERRLNTAMRALRDALGDNAAEPKFIETIRSHGYRWIGAEEVRPVAARQWVAVAAAAALTFLLPASSIAPVAHLRRAEAAVEQWRDAPTRSSASQARLTLAAAQHEVGPDPDLDALAAELSLAADWDWPRAERLYRRALAADPHNFAARRGLAWLYVNSGQRREAWAEVTTLLAAAPLSTDRRADLGWLMLRMERADLALALCAAPDRNHVNLLSCRHTALAALGATGAARDVALVLLEVVDAGPAVVAEVRQATAEAGYRRFLDWRVEGFLPQEGHWFQQAQIEAEAGRLEQAMTSLEKAAAARDPLMVKIGSTAAFDALAGSLRFRALQQAVLARRS